MQPDNVVDATGQACPMPVILTARAMKELAAGQVVLVKATDAGARSDIPSWIEMTGNQLLSTEEHDGVLLFTIEKVH